MEESTLAHLTHHDLLSDIFAWYSLIGNAGTALGMMACGWAINILQSTKDWEYVSACRTIFFAYAAIGVLKFILSISLSSKVEAEDNRPQQPENQPDETQPLLRDQPNNTQEEPERKSLFAFLGDRNLVSLVIRLFILFGLDSFASGLASLYVISITTISSSPTS